MRKMLLHFVARQHRRDALTDSLPGLADQLHRDLDRDDLSSTLLVARRDDPLRMAGDGRKTTAFDATLELRAAGLPADPLVAAVGELAEALADLVQPDLCAVQIGDTKRFFDHPAPDPPAPIRLQYAMRRRHDFTPSAYLERYENVHSQFGLRTTGIADYVQFHIDPDASRRACRGAGFGVSEVSSVSELHMASLEAFFAAGKANASLGAQADEDAFVDKKCSLMWISDVVG